MRVVAVALTLNPVTSGRVDWLREAVTSLAEADEVVLLDNGSSEPLPHLDGLAGLWRNTSGVTTCGRGNNVQAEIARKRGADITVFSDDDIVWHPGWRVALEQFWANAPDDVIIAGAHVEPDYPWNARTGETLGHVTRTSSGSGTWTFRTRDTDRIFPCPDRVQGWNDVPVCRRLHAEGLRIAQLGIATHRGDRSSTWGNQSWRLAGEA